MKLQPLSNRIHLRDLDHGKVEDLTYGNRKVKIIIPQNSADMHGTHMQAEILAVGPEVFDAALQPGTRVITERWRRAGMGKDGEGVVYEDDIIAILLSTGEQDV